jgi:hypothetical protein
MKKLLIIAVFAFCAVLNAQEKLLETTVTDTSSTYMLKLLDNTSLTGKILERNSNEITFYDITIGKVTIPVLQISSFTRLTGNQMCILTTNDGKTFTGLLLSRNDKESVIKTESLGNLTISNSKIKDIKFIEKDQMYNGRYYFPNPHATRYFFGPSAVPLKKGEGYYQNAWIFANSVQMGVSDHFSMGGGIVIPVLFFITPKVGYKVNDNLYLGGGILAASTISSDIGFGIGVGYGTITIGSQENNFTVNAGWGAMKQQDYVLDAYNNYVPTRKWEFAKRPMFSISAMTRIAPKCALITENWFFATKDYTDYTYSKPVYNYHAVITFGFRLMGEKNSFDLALAMPLVGSGTIGFPYLDYVYKF